MEVPGRAAVELSAAMSANRPWRHFAATQQFGRFRNEAGIQHYAVEGALHLQGARKAQP